MAMEFAGVEVIGKPLGSVDFIDGDERIVFQGMVYPRLAQTPRQPVVTVEIDLEAERSPGGNPQVHQPECFVDEVEVVMQALALNRFEPGVARRLVGPTAKRRAPLHRREDMHQTGSTATLSQDILDTPFLAERLVGADELDRKASLLRQMLSVGTNIVTHRLGPARVILD